MLAYKNKYLENKELKQQLEEKRKQIDELYALVNEWRDEAFKLKKELELMKPIEQRSDIELAHLALYTPLNDTWSSLWRLVNNEIDKRYSAYMENKDKV